MKTTINSRKLGRPVTFWRPGKYYVHADLGDIPGREDVQICEGGSLRGATVMWDGDDQDAFAAYCRRWFRSYLRNYEM